MQLTVEHLRPIVEERLNRMKEYGEDWSERPVCPVSVSKGNLTELLQNDLLQWQLDHPGLDHSSMYLVARRILGLNLGAIHTSSNVSGVAHL